MKKIEKLYNEINVSEELKKAVSALKDKAAMAEFLKKNDVEGTVEDFVKAVKAKRSAEGSD